MNMMLPCLIRILHSESVRKTYLAFHHRVGDVNRSLGFAALGNDKDSLTLTHSYPIGIRGMDPQRSIFVFLAPGRVSDDIVDS